MPRMDAGAAKRKRRPLRRAPGTFAPRGWLILAKEVRAMATLSAQGDPSEVCAESGDVIVEGPNGVAVTLTPEAAEETGRRMLEAASQARKQRDGGSQG